MLREFKISSPLAVFLGLSTLGNAPPTQDAGKQTQKLSEEFIAAINTKDEKKILAFLEAHGTSSPPPAERVKRILPVANQGAPFKISTFVSSSASEAVFVAKDREGTELRFTISFTGDPPKLAGLMARPGGADVRPPKSYTTWSSYTDLLDQIKKDEKVPAMGIAVLHNGKLELASSGLREIGKPASVSNDDVWSVGSIGKPLCSTLLAKLVEEGKLRWDQTLKEALPGIPMKAAYEGVTLLQIARHRGGIPEDPGMTRDVVLRIVGEAKSPIDIRTNYAKDILGRDPIAPAGKEFHYSNAGYALLSKVIETVEKKPYEEVLRTELFKPLGLSHSYIGADTYPSEIPSGHIRSENGLKPMHFRGPIETLFVGAGGGIMMSVADLAKFGAVHLKGLKGEDGFLKARTVKLMQEGISADGGPNFSYGAGFGVERDPGLPVRHGHNGSNGTFRAELGIYPALNLVVVAIVNAGGEQEPSPGLLFVRSVSRKLAK